MKKQGLSILLSVDWEPDHGMWRSSEQEIEYDGILSGTPVLERLLDELGIPCTWFVETSLEKKRCTTGLFPDLVKRLSDRPADEIGLHLHWRSGFENGSVTYETADPEWIAAQIEHGKAELQSCGASPKSFRSGSFLHVEGLPNILARYGFCIDSSVLWDRCHRLDDSRTRVRHVNRLARARKIARKVVGPIPTPYFTDELSVEKAGPSDILEFPVFYSVLDLNSPSRSMVDRILTQRAGRQRGHRFITLFFHIDELTGWGGQDRLRKDVDFMFLEKLRNHLHALRQQGAEFCTFQEARNIIEASVSDSRRQKTERVDSRGGRRRN